MHSEGYRVCTCSVRAFNMWWVWPSLNEKYIIKISHTNEGVQDVYR